MITNEEIRLATAGDATSIAELSRDNIESGLGWSWTPARVRREIRNRHANVIVMSEGKLLTGFAVMQYLEGEARLNLLGVHPQYREKGVGRRLVRWLEETALANGNGIIYLETRLSNEKARLFYKSLGYKIIQRIPRYYNGKETAIRMAHDLWDDVSHKF